MSNSLPPGPPPADRNPLDFDACIGIVIAFTTVGAILAWSLTRTEAGRSWLNNPILLATPTATPRLTPTLPVDPDAETTLPRVTPAPIPGRVTGNLPIPRTSPLVPVPIPLPVDEAIAEPAVPELEAEPTTSPVVPVPQEKSFADIPENFWALPFITALAEREIISGFEDGTFRPNQPITRAEYAALIQKAFDRNLTQPAINYTDVPADFWAIDAIRESTQMGFLKGYPKNTFRPTQSVTRLQVLLALASGLGLQARSQPSQVLNRFEDAKQIPEYATGAIAADTEAGLVVNHPNPAQLNPEESATRAEVAAMLYQALVRAGKVEPIESQYVVKPQS